MRETLARSARLRHPRAACELRRSPVTELSSRRHGNAGPERSGSASRRSTAARPAARGGSIGMVLLVAIALVGAAVGLLLVGRGNAAPYILVLLAFLATVGVFSLFALATGILRVAGKEADNPVLKSVADEAVDGLLVTDRRGRVIYANAAYLALTDADGRDRRAPGRAGVHRRSRRVGSGLSPAQGGARRPRRAGGGARRRPQGQAGALAAAAGAAAAQRGGRRRADALGRRRRDARPRAAGKHLPGAAARHRLSRPRAGRLLLGRCQRRHLAISTPRSPPGSTTTWRRSAPAGSSSPTSSPATARRC